MAGPLRRGKEGKVLAIKKKKERNLSCCPSKKNIFYFNRNNHVQVYMLNFVFSQQSLCLITSFFKLKSRNLAFLSLKLGGGKEVVKIRFQLFKE